MEHLKHENNLIISDECPTTNKSEYQPEFDSELMIPTKQPVTFSGNRSIKNSKSKLKSNNNEHRGSIKLKETDNFVNIACWNIHGLKGDKADLLKNRKPGSKFYKLFDKNDIIFLSETWRDRVDSDLLEWDDDFQEFPKTAHRDFKKGRSSGGTHLFIKKTLLPHCKVLKQDAYRAWLKLDHELFADIDTDIYICCMYIPPASSRLIAAGKAFSFEKLSAEVAHFDNTGGEIILMGDMNGRVGNALDFVADDVDIDDNLPLPDDYEPDCEIKARNSNDKDVISGHGKDLLRFCKSTKFRIMNGR